MPREEGEGDMIYCAYVWELMVISGGEGESFFLFSEVLCTMHTNLRMQLQCKNMKRPEIHLIISLGIWLKEFFSMALW